MKSIFYRLIDWLIDRLTHSRIDWFCDRLIDWSIDWLIDWLGGGLGGGLMNFKRKISVLLEVVNNSYCFFQWGDPSIANRSAVTHPRRGAPSPLTRGTTTAPPNTHGRLFLSGEPPARASPIPRPRRISRSPAGNGPVHRVPLLYWRKLGRMLPDQVAWTIVASI